MAGYADRLTSLGYAGLFLSLDDGPLTAFWHEAGTPEALAQLSADSSADAEARFLAAEVLFRKHPDYPAEPHRAALAPVYAEALRRSRLANIWGMPGELDGPAGQHLVALGEPAVPALAPLLDDMRQVFYSGSEEATVGNSYRYRVKDFAAFFISQILRLPYTVHQTPQERDTEIERLRAALP